jgi:hypothetical protein
VLVRNHEHRSQAGEIPVVVPQGMRYDPDPSTRGGNTNLVVDKRAREVVESFAILGGTHTNCAGGSTPWGSWITAEEVFNYGSTGSAPSQGVPHGYIFEMPAGADGPVQAEPIAAAGRFSHEAVAWLGGATTWSWSRGPATCSSRRTGTGSRSCAASTARGGSTTSRRRWSTTPRSAGATQPDSNRALTYAIWGPF